LVAGKLSPPTHSENLSLPLDFSFCGGFSLLRVITSKFRPAPGELQTVFVPDCPVVLVEQHCIIAEEGGAIQAEKQRERRHSFRPRRGQNRRLKREEMVMVDPQVPTQVKNVERDEVGEAGEEEEAVGIKTRSGKTSFPAAKGVGSGGVRCGGGGVNGAISRKRRKKVHDAATSSHC
jgi:hypothetical protein